MADILRGYGLAREQAHFKLEQEADVQRRRQRLIKEGKLPSKEDAKKGSAEAEREAGPAPGFHDSLQDFETLPEVLQQRVRLDDPHALRRKQFEVRVKGEPAPLSETELLRARSKILALGAAVGHVPRMSMGRARWGAVPGDALAGAGAAALAGVRQLTPEAREVASRTYVAGVRAVVYGSLLAAVGLAAGGTLAVRSMGVGSGEELGERLRAGLQPLSASLRSWLLPIKQRAEGWLAPAPPAPAGNAAAAGGAGPHGVAPDGGEPPGSSELSRRLRKRYNPRNAAAEGGGGSADP